MRFHKIISFAISLICIISAFCISASANSEALVYTAIGDSIAAGYALDSYTEDGCTPEDGYVAIFGKKLGADVINDLAVTGIDTYGVIELLNNDEGYKEAVRAADVITVSLGSNDLLGPGMEMIAEALTGSPDTSFDVLINLLSSASLSDSLEFARKVSDFIAQPEQQARLDTINERFKENWTLIIDKIRELNPSAELIVTDYYNPFYQFDSLLKEDIVQPLLDEFNLYIDEHEYNNTEYKIANVNELGAKLGYTNVNLIFGQADVHPSAKGHDYIARRIWSLYSGEPFEEDIVTEATVTTTESPASVTAPESSEPAPEKNCSGFPAAVAAAVFIMSLTAAAVIKRK